jgi:hypothetical protein
MPAALTSTTFDIVCFPPVRLQMAELPPKPQ